MIRFAIVGFDLDGTLVDTVADIAASVNHALADAGRATLSDETVARMIGGGVRHLLEQALAATGGGDAAALERILAVQQRHYAAHLADHAVPYPGAIEALDRLAEAGVALGIVTNKREAHTRTLLDRLGLTQRFGSIVGGDTLPNGKPHPDPILRMVEELGGGAAAFVGDSRYDMLAARAAGIPAVACRWGYRNEAVEAIGGDAIIDGFDQLLATLARL